MAVLNDEAVVAGAQHLRRASSNCILIERSRRKVLGPFLRHPFCFPSAPRVSKTRTMGVEHGRPEAR